MSETHVAGQVLVWDDRWIRQRCAWCGTALINVDTTKVAVPESQADEPFPTWPIGAFVRIDGCIRSTVEAETSEESPDAERPPADACLRLDPEVTA